MELQARNSRGGRSCQGHRATVFQRDRLCWREQPTDQFIVYFITLGCWAFGQGSYFRQRSQHVNWLLEECPFCVFLPRQAMGLHDADETGWTRGDQKPMRRGTGANPGFWRGSSSWVQALDRDGKAPTSQTRVDLFGGKVLVVPAAIL